MARIGGVLGELLDSIYQPAEVDADVIIETPVNLIPATPPGCN